MSEEQFDGDIIDEIPPPEYDDDLEMVAIRYPVSGEITVWVPKTDDVMASDDGSLIAEFWDAAEVAWGSAVKLGEASIEFVFDGVDLDVTVEASGEWELHSALVKGNTFYGCRSRAEVER